MSRTAWIHVGTDKTGSTTLQQFFHANRELFALKFNLHYAPGANHAALPLAHLATPVNYPYFKNRGVTDTALIEAQTAKEKKNLVNWLKNHTDGDVLFSFEGLIHLQASEFKRLIDDLNSQGFSRVVAIYYARPHCGYACSAISQRVKMGKLPLEGLHVPAIDHVRILSSMQTVFAKDDLIVRPFVPKLFPNKDLVQDFLDNCLKLNTDNKLQDAKPVERQNESLSLFGIQLGSKIIERLGILKVVVPPAAFNKELGTLLSEFPGPKFELSALSQQLLQKQTKDISAWMKTQFDIDLDDFNHDGKTTHSETERLTAAQILLADALAAYAVECLNAR